MREFMTRVSDYLNERKGDPERKEDRLSLAVIAAVAIVVVVLLLLFRWGYTVHEKKEKEAAEKAKMIQENETLSGMQEDAERLAAATYEEKMKEYLSQNAGEALRQESMSEANALEKKVRELQNTMETVEKELSKVVVERSESDTTEKKTLTALENSVKKAAENIRQMESTLADLSDMMQVVDREKLPALQSQIKDVRTEVERARTEVSDIRESIASLKQEDEKLWKELAAVERNLDKAVEENIKELDSQLEKAAKNFDQMERDMREALRQIEDQDKKLEEKMNAISRDSLSYRYDQDSNTLYLMPYFGR